MAKFGVLLDADGDLPAYCELVSGPVLVVQAVETRLRTFLGDYLLDEAVGIDWIGFSQQKPPDIAGMLAILRREILAVDGVATVITLEGTENTATRTVSFTGEFKLTSGELVTLVVQPTSTDENGVPYILLLLAA